MKEPHRRRWSVGTDERLCVVTHDVIKKMNEDECHRFIIYNRIIKKLKRGHYCMNHRQRLLVVRSWSFSHHVSRLQFFCFLSRLLFSLLTDKWIKRCWYFCIVSDATWLTCVSRGKMIVSRRWCKKVTKQQTRRINATVMNVNRAVADEAHKKVRCLRAHLIFFHPLFRWALKMFTTTYFLFSYPTSMINGLSLSDYQRQWASTLED